jgi:DNA-binding response OmpR family regulator
MNSSLTNLARETRRNRRRSTVKAAFGAEKLVEPENEVRTKRILLADDDLGVREMLGRVLESEHYGVVYAKSGIETIRKFTADPPDLVLLDLNMPEKDGWEAFGKICDKHPFVPVIVITARPHQYGHAVELGVDALMEKPLNIPLLLETIQSLLTESESERTRRLTNPEFKTAMLYRSAGHYAKEATS